MTTYNISKGSFSSGIHLGIHTGRVNQTYKVRFDSSCLYDDSLDSERDWNKLVGWSYSTLPFRLTHEVIEREKVTYTLEPGHHRNSLRLAWRSNKKLGRIELALYYYQDGVRTIVEFTSVEVNKTYTLGIFYKVDRLDREYNPRVVLTATNKEDGFIQTKTIALSKPFIVKWSYKLYPYFGGTNPAWNDMKIEVQET